VSFVQGLKCLFCETAYPVRVGYTCPRCGIGGILDVQYDYAAIRRILTRGRLAARSDPSHWRYRELLPIGVNAALPALSVGGTPLTYTPALARHLGIAKLFLKDDGRNATGSLKDRASSVGVVKAREKRRPIIACASTGNAASSCAGMAASMGLKSVIFVPERAPEPKVTQLLIFGATVLRVRGSYEDAFQLCQRSCEKWGWYNRNSGINPYLVEGKKTAGLEIGEQLAWEPTDWVAVSVGDGCTVAAVWKGFRELKTLGLIARTPRILGVQAEGAAPVTAAFLSGEPMRPIEPATLADSIAVGVPRNWKRAVLAVRESGGTMISSAYKLCSQMLTDHFPADEWNIYLFHFSDGDNSSEADSRDCVKLLKDQLIPVCNMFGYCQVASAYGSGNFINVLHEHLRGQEKVLTSRVNSKDDIYDSIKTFFGKETLLK